MLSKNFYKLMVRKALTFYSLSQIKNIYLKRKKEKKRKERQMRNHSLSEYLVIQF